MRGVASILLKRRGQFFDRVRVGALALQPVRLVPLAIGENAALLTLVLSVVDSIGDNGVLRQLILVRHRLRRLPPASCYQAWRRIACQPIQMLLAAVGLVGAEAVLELLTERNTEHTQPLVVVQTLTHPDSRRMLRIADRLVAVLCGIALECRSRAKVRGLTEDPVGRVQELRGFQNHLDNVLVTMPTRTARWFVRKIEDVHCCGGVGTSKD